MAIIITTPSSDSENGLNEQVFETKEEVFKEVEKPNEEVENSNEVEKDTTEETNEEHDEFSYLKETEEEDDDEDLEEEEQPKKTGFKKRIDKLNSKIAELESRLNTPNEKNEKNEKEEIIKDLEEPQADDFEEYTDYLKALARYEVNQERKALKLKEEEEQIKNEFQNKVNTYNERVAKAKEKYGEERWNNLSKINLPLSVYVQQEIIDAENGPDVLFYLYHNLEEANRIHTLTPQQQVRELTKLSLKLENKFNTNKNQEKNKVSKAPEPLKSISSKTAGKVNKDPGEMSFQEYKAYREKMLK